MQGQPNGGMGLARPQGVGLPNGYAQPQNQAMPPPAVQAQPQRVLSLPQVQQMQHILSTGKPPPPTTHPTLPPGKGSLLTFPPFKDSLYLMCCYKLNPAGVEGAECNAVHYIDGWCEVARSEKLDIQGMCVWGGGGAATGLAWLDPSKLGCVMSIASRSKME